MGKKYLLQMYTSTPPEAEGPFSSDFNVDFTHIMKVSTYEFVWMICIMGPKLRQYPLNFSIVYDSGWCMLRISIWWKKTCMKASSTIHTAAIRWIRAMENMMKGKTKKTTHETNLNRTDGLHYFCWSLKIYFGFISVGSKDHIIFRNICVSCISNSCIMFFLSAAKPQH